MSRVPLGRPGAGRAGDLDLAYHSDRPDSAAYTVVAQADQLVWVADKIMWEVLTSPEIFHHALSLSLGFEALEKGWDLFTGALLRIDGRNRTVIYHVMRYVDYIDGWEAVLVD